MTDHIADVRRFDPLASEDIVDRIVQHLGVALRSPVSASIRFEAPGQMARIRERWCGRKLGCADRERADQAIAMAQLSTAGQAEISRVTFYYLVAKQLGRLDGI